MTSRFNPVLGFYRVATRAADETGNDDYQFQSRAGFLPRRDFGRLNNTIKHMLFQSRAGFLPRRDQSLGSKM